MTMCARFTGLCAIDHDVTGAHEAVAASAPCGVQTAEGRTEGVPRVSRRVAERRLHQAVGRHQAVRERLKAGARPRWALPSSSVRGQALRRASTAEYVNVNSNAVRIAAMDAWTEVLPDTGMNPRLDRDTSNCSIARTLEIVGEKWTILILREVWYGSSRFGDFERVLRCPRNLLATRLRMLVEEGILATETYKEPGRS